MVGPKTTRPVALRESASAQAVRTQPPIPHPTQGITDQSAIKISLHSDL